METDPLDNTSEHAVISDVNTVKHSSKATAKDRNFILAKILENYLPTFDNVPFL